MLIVLCVWLIAAAVALPYFDYFGWGSYEYIYRVLSCSWTYKGSYFYSYYVIGLGLIVPMIIIPYCYIRIYLFAKKSKQRVLKHSSEGSGRFVNNTTLRDRDIKLLKTVATILAAFMTMWAPYTSGIVFNFYGNWPDWYLQTGVALLLSNSSINFIIYGIMNTNFRRSYSMIYYKICCRKWDTESSDIDMEERFKADTKVNSTLKLDPAIVGTITAANI
ncbi:melatonin receptor type 1A-like [Amphiura filiformis]|uniref:melatonin receptor type 1A-like n=1 Tax=Amphiura filiformis TaxID=82378 RepID=UPI003B214984